VTAVVVAELDGRPVVVSGSGDQTVQVSDLATGDLVGNPFTGHTNLVNAVTVAELDGHPVVLSGSDDHTVQVWNLADFTRAGVPFTSHTGPVWSLAALTPHASARLDAFIQVGVGAGNKAMVSSFKKQHNSWRWVQSAAPEFSSIVLALAWVNMRIL
jgi:WD40 repeat protein